MILDSGNTGLDNRGHPARSIDDYSGLLVLWRTGQTEKCLEHHHAESAHRRSSQHTLGRRRLQFRIWQQPDGD